MAIDTNLIGKVVIVTGGARGLGREFVLTYAAAGANIMIADIRAEALESVQQEVIRLGSQAIAVATDVCDEPQVGVMLDAALNMFGRVDVLVTCAGGGLGLPLCETWERTPEEWRKVIDVNLNGVFICARAVIPGMIAQGGGSIINISSWVGQPGSQANGFAAYSIAKFGVEGLTQLLAAELAGYAVRVNALRPGGPVATPDVLDVVLNGRTEISPADVAELHALPHGPLVRPDIIRPLALYLASDESMGVNGASFECKQWNLDQGYGGEAVYRWNPTNSVN
jgi:NAD(P)-dependent dehydrogenase (short-subunit alcohol dehydrogenase family)